MQRNDIVTPPSAIGMVDVDGVVDAALIGSAAACCSFDSMPK